jgi:hypothetical protein
MADERAWTTARRYWLELAVSVQAPPDLCRQVVEMPLTDRAVEAARAVYRTAADHSVHDARKAGQWVRIIRIRQAEAEALYQDAGSPVPPPADIVAMYREAKSAVLLSLATHSPVAELAGSSCCPTCRGEDGGLFKIAAELRKPRLPHEGCPRGLCGCDWFVAMPDVSPKRKRRRKRQSPAGSAPDATTPSLVEGATEESGAPGADAEPA